MSAYYNYNYLKKKESVLKRDKYKCANCGSTDRNDLNVHHIVPLSAGGSNTDTNMIVLCSKCHKAIHFGKHRDSFDITDNHKKSTKRTDEEAYAIFDKYFSGRIGTAELKNQMGFAKSYKITACPQFKKYLKDHKIVKYRNNFDINFKKAGRVYNGDIVGYIIYEDGREERMTYMKVADPETPVVVKRKSVDELYDDYFSGAIGFSEMDYRMSYYENYGDKDFRTSPGFKQYMIDHGIESYQNNVDMIIRIRGNVAIGDEVGYVIYKDGTRELMIHH